MDPLDFENVLEQILLFDWTAKWNGFLQVELFEVEMSIYDTFIRGRDLRLANSPIIRKYDFSILN